MINQINPGALVPVYTTQIDHTKYLTQHADGWAIRAPRKTLIPIIFWSDTIGVPMSAFRLFNIDTGAIYDLSPFLFESVERVDLTRTWYYLPVLSDIGVDVPCGNYQAYFKVGLSEYWTDIMHLMDICGFEAAEVIQIGCNGNNYTFNLIDNLQSAIVAESTDFRYDNQVAWTDAGVVGNSFVLSPDLIRGSEYILIRRRVTTECGNKLERCYSFYYDFDAQCNDTLFHLIADKSTYASGNVWLLEYSDDTRWGDVIFPGAFKNRLYFDGYFNFPQTERATEVIIDNLGNEIVSNSLTKATMEMHVDRVPDFAQFSLSAIRDYTDVTLLNPARGVQVKSLNNPTMTFEPLSSGYYSRGILRFDSQQNFDWACIPAEETQAV